MRKQTTRRINKRLGNKKARAAERQVLGGGNVKAIQSESWNARIDSQPTIPDVSSNGKNRKGDKKDIYCPDRPGQRRHEYLEEDEFHERPFSRWFSSNVSILVKERICVHCGKIETRRKYNWKPY